MLMSEDRSKMELFMTADRSKILIPTGRGGYVVFGEKTLEQLLDKFDRAHPEHTDISREDVIRAYECAKELAGE